MSAPKAGDDVVATRPPAPRILDPRLRQSQLEVPNLLVLLAVAGAGGVLLVLEGYLPQVNAAFAAYTALVVGVGLWFGAFEMSRRRLLATAAVAALGGFATQVVGVDVAGLWSYRGAHETYFFVPSTFVFASTLAYGLTVLVLGPRLRRVITRLPRGWNVALVAALLGAALAGGASQGALGKPLFVGYYAALGLFGVYASLLMDLGTLVALVLAAVFVGAASEMLGARSGLWTFTGTGWVPPWWLVLGSWPLEILLHYGLGGLLAREPLFAKPRLFEERPVYRDRPDHPMHRSKASQLVVVERGSDKLAALDRVLERAGFFEAVERRREALGKAKDALRIAIKPNLMFMYSPEDRSTFTDPELVEHLVDRLLDRGYRDVVVVEAQSAYGNFFHGREVPRVAEVAGYAPRGRYRIVDLTAEKVPHRFEGPLGEHPVGPTWRDADFRVSFAKNKTHTWAWYTLTIKNIYGALAEQDKIAEYHFRREIYYPTIDMLVAFPVHFALIDAHLSADGPFGIFADKHPNPTETVIGGESPLAVDWVGASKMGLDPMQSRYMQLAVQAFGRPEPTAEGDTSPYAPWVNVPKPVIDFWDSAEESYTFTNVMFAALNRDYVSSAFPPKRFTKWVAMAHALLGPLGGIFYKAPPRRGGER